MKVLYDPGSQISVINKRLCTNQVYSMQNHKDQNIEFSTLTRTGSLLGLATVNIEIGKIRKTVKIFVSDSEMIEVLLGLDLIWKFNLKCSNDYSIIQTNHKLDVNSLKVEIFELNENNGYEAMHLSCEKFIQNESVKLAELLQQFGDIFAKDKFDVGLIKGSECCIELESNIPVNLRAYRCSEIDQQIIDDEIKSLLRVGFIRKSN